MPRLTIRHRLPDGTLTDVIGEVDDVAADPLVVTDRRGLTHTVARDRVVASRLVPPPPAPRSGLAGDLDLG